MMFLSSVLQLLSIRSMRSWLLARLPAMMAPSEALTLDTALHLFDQVLLIIRVDRDQPVELLRRRARFQDAKAVKSYCPVEPWLSTLGCNNAKEPAFGAQPDRA